MTGDTVSSPCGEPAARAATELLAGLEAPLGVFACPGNHEDWAGPVGDRVYDDAGVPLLHGPDRTRELLGGRLVLHGVRTARDELPSGRPDATDVLLCHYPVVLERAAAAGMDLVLAGHSHGGQVRLPVWGALWLPFDTGPYEQGWFAEGETRMFVSRGVGTSMAPVRFLCRPEVALIELRLPGA